MYLLILLGSNVAGCAIMWNITFWSTTHFLCTYSYVYCTSIHLSACLDLLCSLCHFALLWVFQPPKALFVYLCCVSVPPDLDTSCTTSVQQLPNSLGDTLSSMQAENKQILSELNNNTANNTKIKPSTSAKKKN